MTSVVVGMTADSEQVLEAEMKALTWHGRRAPSFFLITTSTGRAKLVAGVSGGMTRSEVAERGEHQG
jgi:hypothetical protein